MKVYILEWALYKGASWVVDSIYATKELAEAGAKAGTDLGVVIEFSQEPDFLGMKRWIAAGSDGEFRRIREFEVETE